MFMHDDLFYCLCLCLSLPYTPTPTYTERTMPTYRQQRNVVVLVLHRSADVGGEERGGVRMYIYQPQYGNWIGDTMAHLYYTVLYYTTLPVSIYLYVYENW